MLALARGAYTADAVQSAIANPTEIDEISPPSAGFIGLGALLLIAGTSLAAARARRALLC